MNLDLLDFFRGIHPWGKLDRLVGLMQRDPRSWLRLALAEDDEMADQVVAQDDEPASSRPALEEWSPEVQYLAATVDRLGDTIAAVIAAAGGKPPKIKPLPRPETAFDRARWRVRNRRHLELVAEVEAAQQRWRAARSG